MHKRAKQEAINRAVRMIKIYASIQDHDPKEAARASYVMLIADGMKGHGLDEMHFEAMTTAYNELNEEAGNTFDTTRQELLKSLFDQSKHN